MLSEAPSTLFPCQFKLGENVIAKISFRKKHVYQLEKKYLGKNNGNYNLGEKQIGNNNSKYQIKEKTARLHFFLFSTNHSGLLTEEALYIKEIFKISQYAIFFNIETLPMYVGITII